MSDIGKEFFEKSKYTHLTTSAQERGAAQPGLQIQAPPDAAVVELPPPDTIGLGDYALRKAIEQRRSVRSFSKEPLSAEELSYLLWCTQGVQKVMEKQYRPGVEILRTMRTVPSAGARHAFETYVFANKVHGVPSALYWFDAVEHRLVEHMKDMDLASTIAKRCAEQTWMKSAAAVFIWVANTYRMTWRYSERGYRYLLLDAGHVCQNLYLAAESIGCGACAIGAYDDDAMNDLLGLDGKDEFVIYAGTVGRKP